MIQSLFKKTVLTIFLCGLTANVYTSDESKSANTTTASKITTALASVGIFGGITSYILSNTIIEQVCELQQQNKDKNLLFGNENAIKLICSAALISGAFITLGSMRYLYASAHNWKTKLRSITASLVTAYGSLFCSLALHAALTSNKFDGSSTTSFDYFHSYDTAPIIGAGLVGIGYLFQPVPQKPNTETLS
jgi:hypothetical protein